MASGRPEADVLDDEAMSLFCGEMKIRFAPRGLELFAELGFDDAHASFALATEDCCFLVDRVRGSLLRDYHELHRAVAKLAALEPASRIFGILLADADHAPPAELRRFGRRHGIAMADPQAASGFIEEKLAEET